MFAEAGLGRAIVEAAGTVGPLHPGPDVDGEIPLKESVVVLDDMRSRQRRRVWRTWPLPFYVARYHRRLPPTALSPTRSPTAPTPPDVAAAEAETEMAQAVLEDRRENVFDAFTATVETPTSIPLDQRVAMHLAALDGALAWLTR